MDDRRDIWMVRVGDGKNFKGSKKKIWGMKRGYNNCILTIIKKIKEGDVLAFHSNKEGGSKLLGFAHYIKHHDQQDEPLVSINCLSNEELGWIGDESWTIQIHYENLYNTSKQNILIKYQCAAIISNYDKIIFNQDDKIIKNMKKSWFCSGVNNLDEYCLRKHYENFINYAEPT